MDAPIRWWASPLISHSGNPNTLARIERAGLQSCISTNEEILSDCDFIFLLIRPNQIGSIKVGEVNTKAVIVSCMAGMYGMIPGNDSVENIPSHLTMKEKKAFLKSAATPGGVTEAVLLEFQKTKILSLALNAGTNRARLLAEEIRKNV
jgi:pyrroline-5-carboxylate reductase